MPIKKYRAAGWAGRSRIRKFGGKIVHSLKPNCCFFLRRPTMVRSIESFATIVSSVATSSVLFVSRYVQTIHSKRLAHHSTVVCESRWGCLARTEYLPVRLEGSLTKRPVSCFIIHHRPIDPSTDSQHITVATAVLVSGYLYRYSGVGRGGKRYVLIVLAACHTIVVKSVSARNVTRS
jgi:hypothetical protein